LLTGVGAATVQSVTTGVGSYNCIIYTQRGKRLRAREREQARERKRERERESKRYEVRGETGGRTEMGRERERGIQNEEETQNASWAIRPINICNNNVPWLNELPTVERNNIYKTHQTNKVSM